MDTNRENDDHHEEELEPTANGGSQENGGTNQIGEML